jgi:trehalose utilization protein
VLWTILPGHEIVRGVPNPVVIPAGERYGEPFDIPPPYELVFISSYEGGEVVRSGCAWQGGRGRIFFFAPGHEESPIYFQPEIRRVLAKRRPLGRPACRGPAEGHQARRISQELVNPGMTHPIQIGPGTGGLDWPGTRLDHISLG